ncbi:MAG: hypothetical protein ABIC91_04735 [Nanoarchaeota archaeon]|nr:hypothetical protein [Nanoarchaeota archaeon]MBU1030681.1 hypothetical protein [Nanoarchaeota archaeon]MBU1849340.1 hypothetical protein [Nanoarchaeota archaeon]
MGLLKRIGKTAVIYGIAYLAFKDCSGVLKAEPEQELKTKEQYEQIIDYKTSEVKVIEDYRI